MMNSLWKENLSVIIALDGKISQNATTVEGKFIIFQKRNKVVK